MTASTDAIASRREFLTCRRCAWGNGNIPWGPARAFTKTTVGREIYINGGLR
jgi:hypothetical protein